MPLLLLLVWLELLTDPWTEAESLLSIEMERETLFDDEADALAEQATLAEQSGVARAAREAAGAVVGNDAAAGAQALVGLSEASLPASEREQVDTSGEDNDEDDLLDIFLEEAREVVGNGLDAVGHLQVQPGDLEHLTTLRRAFHTLKGSSRMVGLDEFGEAHVVSVADVGLEKILVHDEQRPEPSLAFALSRLASGPYEPTPVGIFRAIERPSYEIELSRQLAAVQERGGAPDLDGLLGSGNVWEVV